MMKDVFVEKFAEDVKTALAQEGVDVTTRITYVRKINEAYAAITVTPEGSNIGMNLNAEIFFDAWENGEDYAEVVAQAVKTVKTAFVNHPEIDSDALTDYDQMRDKLVMQVVSAETNADMLLKVPHVIIEDMAVVYRFLLDSDDDGRATILVTNQLLDTMCVTPEQLHADAVENAPKLKPAGIKGLIETIFCMQSGEDIAQVAAAMGMPPAPHEERLYVATVPDGIHGAAVLAYPTFMDQAAERAGGDFYILPSSIHEVLIVPDNGTMSLQELKAMVMEVNATQVAPEEKLTDSVYHYSVKEKKFERC